MNAHALPVALATAPPATKPPPPSPEQQQLAQLVFGPEAVKAALVATEASGPAAALAKLSASSVVGIVVCVLLLVAAVVAGVFIAHRRGVGGASGWPVATISGIAVLALGVVIAALASGAVC